MTLRILLLLFALTGTGCSLLEPTTPADQQAAVASAHPLATDAGLKVLENGGNAFDAAIATAAVLGVVEPYAAGIGGGGFWLIREAGEEPVFVDARETAPARAHETMYLDENGEVHPDRLSINGPTAAGIPGQPAAFDHLSRRYGALPLETTLADAIELAETGFPVDEHYRRMARWRLEVLADDRGARPVFLQDGEVPDVDAMILQPQLAGTLRRLAQSGAEGFYQGDVAKKLVSDVVGAGGIWREEDLRDYRVIEREPIRIDYGDWTLWSAPPPSSGGIAMAQMLGMMNHRPLAAEDTGELSREAARIHYLSEMMRRAYRDRALHLGDPDFTDVPVRRLLDNDYLRALVSDFSMQTATDSEAMTGDLSAGTHTTHLSVVDGQGNQVSATLSINLPFGSGFLSPTTGVLLNNEMDDFSIHPGEPNAYGLVGGEANRIEPGKRPLSSMTPTLMEGPGQAAIIGAPGGSRIITMVFLGALDVIDGRNPEAVVSRPRFHHQYLPDEIQHEPGYLTGSLAQELESLGHSLEDVGREYGDMQLILIDTDSGEAEGASDPRGVGEAAALPKPSGS